MAENLYLEVDHNNYMVFDYTTPRNRSSGALNLSVDEPYTAVSFGTMYALVTMCDLRIEVRMDPYGDKEDWKDGKWAREQAFKAIEENLSPAMWSEVIQGLLEIGKAQGREALQKEFRQLLG